MVLAVTLTASVWVWAQPQGWVINSRDYLSEEDQIGALWELDLASGDARLEDRSRIQQFLDIEGLSFSLDRQLYGIDDDTNTLIRIGTSSGNAIAVNQEMGNLGLPSGNHDFGMTFTCEGRLLISTDSESLGLSLYEADPETGQTERIGDLGAPIVDMTSLGNHVYGIGRGMATDANGAAPNLYRIDTATGRAELVGALGEEAGLYNKAGLAADSDGTLWAVTDRRQQSDRDSSRSSQVLRIDPATGQAERVADVSSTDDGGSLIGLESLAIAPPDDCGRGALAGTGAIPVPVLSAPALWTLVLLVLALAAVPLRRLGAN
ncbi:hypothetical protein DZK25_09385 [Wenzhouxiangella sp. 15181]|nr:hypothetical protein DZK25_09385 [Wenzhouxiangella sp. 15181]RFP69132.1 hypothetical protein DZK26_05010 [Wenzhouxiangella sp. 15190]